MADLSINNQILACHIFQGLQSSDNFYFPYVSISLILLSLPNLGVGLIVLLKDQSVLSRS
jgi:hypothetical protein